MSKAPNRDIRLDLDGAKRPDAGRSDLPTSELIVQAEEVRVKAMAVCDYQAAINAIREKGILSGLRIERREIVVRRVEGARRLPVTD